VGVLVVWASRAPFFASLRPGACVAQASGAFARRVRAAWSAALAPAWCAMSSCASAALSGGRGERSGTRECVDERCCPGPGVVDA
jgi:hypothetical protein